MQNLRILAAVILLGLISTGAWFFVYSPKSPIRLVAPSATRMPQKSLNDSVVPASSSTPADISSHFCQSSIANPVRPEVKVHWAHLPPNAQIVEHRTDAVPFGERAVSLVAANGKYFNLTPNQEGQFEQITIAPRSKVTVQLAYPDGQPGDVVALEVEDGGNIDGKGIAEVAQLDANNQLQFSFTVNEEDGIYRIMARTGGDTKMLAFWVNSKS